MADFHTIMVKVQQQLDKMKEYPLFQVGVERNELVDLYLESFPEGTNPVYKERTEHDCQCCRQFIRDVGNVVSIIDGKMVTVWDFKLDNFYGIVAKALSKYVKSKKIVDRWYPHQRKIGTPRSVDLSSSSTILWEHFNYDFPVSMVNPDPASLYSQQRSDKEVLKRSLDEITLEAAEIVQELIVQNSLYRGADHKKIVNTFIDLKKEYDGLKGKKKDLFCWEKSVKLKGAGRIRNTSIGTLLLDISSGTELTEAVRKFEKMVAPENYQRTTTIATKGMIKKATERFFELGYEEQDLIRRPAVAEDITINNVLFADRSVKPAMNVFEELEREIPDKTPKLDKVEEVSVDKFISEILPKADSLEVFVDNKHEKNLVNLVAPTNRNGKSMFKWPNNFSLSYIGNLADSIMKQNVKSAGGDVDGDLRFSIQWNEDGKNHDDLDAHCVEADSHRIYYRNKRVVSRCGGMLDVDIMNPRGVAVENIIYKNRNTMKDGKYAFYVHTFARRGGTSGFRAEIEFDGQIYKFEHNGPTKSDSMMKVATVTLNKGVFTIETHMDSSVSSKNVWNIPTQKFNKVTMVMKSPNYWDGEGVGNEHLMFMLEGCRNDEPIRGFYNEFLRPELKSERKVFEMLGSKMMAKPTDNQLAGLGFSVTQRNEVLCRVRGKFSRDVKIKF